MGSNLFFEGLNSVLNTSVQIREKTKLLLVLGDKRLLLSELYGFKSLHFEEPDLKISVFFSDSLQMKEKRK